MPILGVIASSKLTAVGTPAYESIATVSVGAGGSNSIQFTSIPNTYKHLQIRYMARNTASNFNAFLVTYNSDTSASYDWHILYGTGSGVGNENGVTDTNIRFISIPGGATPTAFNAGIIDILDYANTSKNKTMRVQSGIDTNSQGYVNMCSGLWRNTSAISTISITNISGGDNFVQYTHFALYGIKGA
jgi:hypothetical protein